MSLQNKRIYGLNVLSFLSEVEDKDAALNALNLPLRDLDIIRGTSNAGISRGDWISLSRLSVPFIKTLDRYRIEVGQYSNILNKKAGTDSILLGNLGVNGSISGKSVRYRYVSGSGPSALVKIADISTSKVSAWSSAVNPPGATDPIFYGARVGITTGGSLQFGTPTSPSQVRLQTTITPQTKEFDSELPTHKINCTIGGQTVSLYAMKGIPLIFTGFFRDLDASVRLTSLINDIPPSWKIVDTDNSNSFVRFANQGGVNSSINYRSTRLRERFIQFYYNPENISEVNITSGNITTIPESKLTNLSLLNLSFNSLRNFPDLNFFSPNIQTVRLSFNPFYLSDTASERTLNSTIISKIPAGIRELQLAGTFFGSIQANIIGNRFTQLRTLNLSRANVGGPYFHPDSSDLNAPIPNVPNTCESYNIASNDFRTIGASSGSSYNVKELTNLVSLDLSGNSSLTDPSFSISDSNDKIATINISSTGLVCPSLIGKQSLQSFNGTYNGSIGSIFTPSNTYKFDNCNSLTSLSFYVSGLTGAIPKFTNISLSGLDLYATQLTGGDISGDTTYCIPQKTFEFCTKLSFFRLYSPNLIKSPIHPDVFTYTPAINYIYLESNRIPGSLPSLSICAKLQYLYLRSNSFTGNVYSLISNPEIIQMDVSYNSLSGSIPGYRNRNNLTHLLLFNNQFTSLNQFTNLPSLTYLYAHNNQIAGEIPSFTECPNLEFLLLFNNKFSSYKIGAFADLYKIRYIDISNNLLTQFDINTIIEDLFKNYQAVKRGGIAVNLKGNSVPGISKIETIDFLKSKGWSIVYD